LKTFTIKISRKGFKPESVNPRIRGYEIGIESGPGLDGRCKNKTGYEKR